MAKHMLSPTQERLLILFKEIVEICDKHNIIYYLAGGTLIGALRHGGFIPWDDDMDIMMTRDNWHKFVKACETDLPSNRVLGSPEIDCNYTNMFGRYIDTETSSIHKSDILGEYPAGYVVDIIVLDPIPDCAEAKDDYIKKLMLYSDIIVPQVNYSFRWGINASEFTEIIGRVKHEGKEKILREIESDIFCYDEKECPFLILRWGGVPFVFDKDMYGSSRWSCFEGIPCRIPDRTNDYLVQHYGDEWAYIPNHGERESHEAVFSLTTSYEKIREDYRTFIDDEKTRQTWIDRKKFFFGIMDDKHKSMLAVNYAIAISIKMELEKKIEISGVDLDAELSKGNYECLNQIFNDYYYRQNSRELIGREDFAGIWAFNNPSFVNLDDHVLYIAMMTLIETNRMSMAMRFLEIRKQAKGELTEELASAEKMVLRFRGAVSDYDRGLIDESMRKVIELHREFPNNMSVHMLLTRIFVEKSKYEDAKKLIDEGIEKWNDEGYYRKYLGDYYLYAEKNVESAIVEYKRAEKTTNNGMILQDISNTFEKVPELKGYNND